MSLLGNFLLRVTSAAIAKRTAGVPEVPLADAASAHPDLTSLQDALQELHGRTTTYMDQMEVALAIKEVMDVLDKVGSHSIVIMIIF
jgi:methionyl-tRNA synthetase